MARVRVVLVRPENPANIGAVARVVTNTGLEGIDLVSPGDWRRLEAWRTAWRAEDVLEGARVFDDLSEAVGESVYVAGFVGRSGMRVPPITPRDMVSEMAGLSAEDPVALVFGPESTGLSEPELRLCPRRVSIPSHPRQPSLNLAQAVMVAGYEVFVGGREAEEPRERASHAQWEAALVKLEDAFVALGFLTDESAPTRFAEWRELFGRAGLSPREARMLTALGRKIGNVARIAREARKARDDS